MPSLPGREGGRGRLSICEPRKRSTARLGTVEVVAPFGSLCVSSGTANHNASFMSRLPRSHPPRIRSFLKFPFSTSPKGCPQHQSPYPFVGLSERQHFEVPSFDGGPAWLDVRLPAAAETVPHGLRTVRVIPTPETSDPQEKDLLVSSSNPRIGVRVAGICSPFGTRSNVWWSLLWFGLKQTGALAKSVSFLPLFQVNQPLNG